MAGDHVWLGIHAETNPSEQGCRSQAYIPRPHDFLQCSVRVHEKGQCRLHAASVCIGIEEFEGDHGCKKADPRQHIIRTIRSRAAWSFTGKILDTRRSFWGAADVKEDMSAEHRHGNLSTGVDGNNENNKKRSSRKLHRRRSTWDAMPSLRYTRHREGREETRGKDRGESERPRMVQDTTGARAEVREPSRHAMKLAMRVWEDGVTLSRAM